MNAKVITQEPPRSLMMRAAVLTYGVAAYLVGVGTLLGTILIMLGVIRFTGGPLDKLGWVAAVTLDFLLLVAFAVQHSVMARTSFKAKWTRIIPAAAERSTYLLATGLVLVPLLVLWQPMPTIIWSVESPILRLSLLGLALAGWVYLLAASFAINHFELFGLQQAYQAFRGRQFTESPFRERWMYRFDRHPIMTGVLVGIWVTPTMTLDHLLFAIGSTVYIWVGVFFEERSLRRQWGQLYEEYSERAGTIVPTFTAQRSTPVLNVVSTSTRPSKLS